MQELFDYVLLGFIETFATFLSNKLSVFMVLSKSAVEQEIYKEEEEEEEPSASCL